MISLAQDLASAGHPVRFAARLGFIAEPWQQQLLRTRARRLLVASARQVGKSHTTSLRAVHTAVYGGPESLVLLISPTQRQSDELLLKCRNLYRALGRPLGARAESTTTLELDNGSRIVSLPGTEGTTRGFAGARLLVIDEAARVPDEVFEGVLVMAASDGTVACLSTPHGQRGWFHGLWEATASGWEKHRVDVHQSQQWDAQRIEEMRRSVPANTWAGDYLAQFTDTDESLFSAESIRAAFGHNFAPLFPIGDPE